jgi:hypothetical protein
MSRANATPSSPSALPPNSCPARGGSVLPPTWSPGAWPGMQTAQRPEACILSTPVGSCGDTHVKLTAREFHHRRLSRRLESPGPDGQHSRTTGL